MFVLLTEDYFYYAIEYLIEYKKNGMDSIHILHFHKS